MKTVLEILTVMQRYLEERMIFSGRRQAEELLSTALGVNRLQLYLEHDRPLSAEEIEVCREFLYRRGRREPIQYIGGDVDFYHCQISVTPDVLIPRSETEQLVDHLVKALAPLNLENRVFWDICCGSGCIGIALKKRFPKLQVILSDISLKALEIARLNAKANGVDVDIFSGDLLSPFSGKKSHFVVSNPPYVSKRDFAELEPEVRSYEPALALIGGDDGLDFYRRFAQELPPFLHSGAKVWFEIGEHQASSMKKLFHREPWIKSSVSSDYAGVSRFFSLEIE